MHVRLCVCVHGRERFDRFKMKIRKMDPGFVYDTSPITRKFAHGQEAAFKFPKELDVINYVLGANPPFSSQ